MARSKPSGSNRRLKEYRRKREFRRTAEPQGGAKRRRREQTPQLPLFVVQQHAARRLHFDLRLEVGGVLASWAVPKGPSLDPTVKRLAVRVEDHPLEYADFEGIIPAGQYGAGEMIVWDRGRWEPESDPVRGSEEGHLKFRLFGEKLRGSWALVRTNGAGKGGDDRNWLLIKHRDREADGRDLIAEEPQSVVSGLTVEDLAANGSARGAAGKAKRRTPRRETPSAAGIRGAQTAKMPKSLRPQLAAPAARVPESGTWLHEIKFDGYRILAFVGETSCRLVSRNGKDWSVRFPRIRETLRSFGLRPAVLDGEVVYLRADGSTDFQALQNALRAKRGSDRLAYIVFDLLYFDGYDLTGAPLVERKALLQAALAGRSQDVRFSEHVHGMGEPFFRFACESGLEGIVCKKASAPYRQKRSPDWVKIKCLNRQELVVGGFTRPEGSRKGLGALLLGHYDDAGRLVYSGRVGTGFTQASLNELAARLVKGERKSSPFHDTPAELRGTARWTAPELVVEVEFTEWTRDGRLRHPSYRGIREDKKAREVTREPSAGARPARGGAAGNAADADAKAHAARGPARRQKNETVAGVRLTHPGRVLYPEQGTTKHDLAAYYERIAPWILPHIVERPLMVVRCPQGAGEPCFHQKHVNETLPDAVKSIDVAEGGRSRKYIMIEDLAGLVSLVQLGSLEFHPWGSKADRIESPDRMIFDLDPAEGIAWRDVAGAAYELRALLDDLGLQSFVRATGGKGLHVVVPLVRRSGWEEIKAAAAAVAHRMVERRPERYVRTMSKKARKGKIFIDHFRNGRGATAIASYSTRARPGAPVAAPLSWSELAGGIRPAALTVETVAERMDKLQDDPWRGFHAVRQSLTRGARKALRLGKEP